MGTRTPNQSPAESREQEPSLDLSVDDVFQSVRESYQHLNMTARRYVTLVVIPSLAVAFLTLLGVLVARPPPVLVAPVALLATFLPLVALLYPKIVQDRQRKRIRERFYLFLTHITILSTTTIDRVEIFRLLANEDEYGPIATEMGYIVALVDTWNQSLDDACRMRAQRSSSPLMEDFLERLAYTVGAGQDLSDFLLSEQDTIIEDFSVRYRSQLTRLGLLKDVYISANLSLTFGLVFAIVIPFILGVDPTYLVLGVLGGMVFVQLLFIFAMNAIAPHDPVWYQTEQALARNERVRIAHVVSVALCLLVAAACYGVLEGVLFLDPDRIPLPLYLAFPFTPLLIVGVVMRRAEGRVKKRDENFPAFIRALGAVESVKQSSTSSVLDNLRHKDFGALTEQIRHLYKRLHLRIDSTLAWTFFAGEAGSYLIQKFSDMYVSGRRMGGEPRQLGSLISKNLTEVLNLRKQRSQEVGTIMGVLYGVITTSTFAYFVSLELARLLKEMSSRIDTAGDIASALLHPQVYTIPEIRFWLFAAVLINALLASVMIRIVDRGHPITAYIHFGAFVWVSAIVATVTTKLIESFISV